MTYAMDEHGSILAIEKTGGIALAPQKISHVMRLCHAKICERSAYVNQMVASLELTDRQLRDRLVKKYARPLDAFAPIVFKDTPYENQADSDEEMADKISLVAPTKRSDPSPKKSQIPEEPTPMEVETSEKEEEVEPLPVEPKPKKRTLGLGKKRKGLGKRSKGLGKKGAGKKSLTSLVKKT